MPSLPVPGGIALYLSISFQLFSPLKCLQLLFTFLFGVQLSSVLMIAVVEYTPDRLMLRVKKPEGLRSRCCRRRALAVGGSGGGVL